MSLRASIDAVLDGKGLYAGGESNRRRVYQHSGRVLGFVENNPQLDASDF
jgi:hypothetical protein